MFMMAYENVKWETEANYANIPFVSLCLKLPQTDALN